MVPLVKLIVVIITTLYINSTDSYTSIEDNNEQTELNVCCYLSRKPREKAFQILDNKCNDCYRK